MGKLINPSLQVTLAALCILTSCILLHRNIDDLLVLPSRFNNNCQSPVSSVRQVAGEEVSGMKASSGSGVGWTRTGESDAASRLGDKTSSGKQDSVDSEFNKTHG